VLRLPPHRWELSTRKALGKIQLNSDGVKTPPE